MKKTFYLIMTITMALIAVLWLGYGFYSFQPSKGAFELITTIWTIAAMGSYMYFELYKEQKK